MISSLLTKSMRLQAYPRYDLTLPPPGDTL